MVDQGLLQKTQRGLYTAKDFPFEAHVSLAEVAARSPKAKAVTRAEKPPQRSQRPTSVPAATTDIEEPA